MKCPWLIESFTTTHTEYAGKYSKITEKQSFGECYKRDCPFYYTVKDSDCAESVEHCTRVTHHYK